MSDGAERGGYADLLRHQTTLARFGELALRSNDLDEILTEACRLAGEALGTDLAKGRISMLSVDLVLLLVLRAPVLGQVQANGIVEVSAGDQVGAFYQADGLSLALDLEDCRFSATRLG